MVSPLLQLILDINGFSEEDERVALSADAHPPTSTSPRRFSISGVLVGIAPGFAVAAIESCPEVFSRVSPTEFALHASLTTYEARSAAIAGVLADWRTRKLFECLDGWRDEVYDVYGPGGERLVAIERSAVGLFGVRSFGCHLNGIVYQHSRPESLTLSPNPSDIRMWIARRSYTKPTNPGMLDNIVGGGLPTTMRPTANIIKESNEEAGIPSDLASQARPVSIASMWLSSTTRGLIPDTEYIYDLVLPHDFTPRPTDAEVHQFYLWDLDTVFTHLLDRQFTSEAALVIIDFMIRWGYISPEREPNYLDIVAKLRRSFPFHGPSFC